MGRMSRIVGEFREQWRRARAELQGVARSQAVMIKQAKDVPELEASLRERGKVPRPIPGATVRMRDGKLMIFYTDGSLRHYHGVKPGKAARKAIKRQRALARRGRS